MNLSNLLSKIDTKEKMHVLTFAKADLTAKTTDAFKDLIFPYLKKEIRNLVLDFSAIQSVDETFSQTMITTQETFYKEKASLVYCCLADGILDFFDQHDLLDRLNYTPTESEAWDIVQMDEIERELF